jgi:hypothetical protein
MHSQSVVSCMTKIWELETRLALLDWASCTLYHIAGYALEQESDNVWVHPMRL